MEKNKKHRVKEVLPAAITGTVGATALKLGKDVGDVSGKLIQWERSMIPHRNYLRDIKTPTLAKSEKIIEEYAKGGRNLARSRILGIRVGTIMKGLGTANKTLELQAAGKLNKKTFKEEIGGIREHYKVYTDPKATPGAIKAHMIHKGIQHDFSGEWANKKIFTKDIKKIIDDPKIKFQEKIKQVTRKNKDAGIILRKSIVGTASKYPEQIGEVRRLAGDAKAVVSTPELYRRYALPQAKALKHLSKKVGIISLAATPILASIPVINKYLKKNPKKGVAKTLEKLAKKIIQLEKDTKKHIAGVAAIGAGGVAVGAGAKQAIKPVKEIGITYGTMQAAGEGHKNPGQSIAKALKKDERFKKYKVTEYPRDPHGIFRGPGKKITTLIDTGLGHNIRGNEKVLSFNPVPKTHHHNLPKNLKYFSRLGYQTDLLDFSKGAKGGPAMPAKSILAYGPETKKLKKEHRAKRVYDTGKGLTPALDPDLVKEFSKPVDKKNVVKELSKHLDKTQAQNFAKMKNKSWIVVSGSGRGDYVATRSKEMAEALKKHKLDTKYGVVSLFGGSKGAQHAIADVKNVTSVGRLPLKTFNRAQTAGEIHWGSTGASSHAESMLKKNIQALPTEWGDKYQGIAKGSIAGRDAELMKAKNIHGLDKAHLDEWNAGQLSFSEKQKGVLKADTADDIVKALKNPKQMEELAKGAIERSAHHAAKFEPTHKKMLDAILHETKRNVRKIRGIGAGKVLAGAGLIAGGAYLFRPKKKKI